MKKRLFMILITVLSVSLLLSACSCNHEWTEADFTAPKTCALCGETEGEPLPYSVSTEMIEKVLKSRETEEIAALLKTAASEGNQDQFQEIILNYASETVTAIDWDGFAFLRSLIPELSKDISSELEQLMEENYETEVLSFLSGEWVRLDNSDLDGCVLDIKVSGSSRVAMVTDVSNVITNGFGFAVGDMKWTDIQVIDRNTIQFQDMGKGGSVGPRYSVTVGILDYDRNLITTHSSELALSGNDQIWVRKSFAQENSQKSVLTEEDFIVQDIHGTEPMNMLELMGSTGFKYGYFYSYEDPETSDTGFDARTSRGIEVGHHLSQVEEAYGMGGKCLYVKQYDAFYNAFKLGYNPYGEHKPFMDILENQVAYRTTYVTEKRSGPSMSFLFDKNDTVVGILYFNARLENNIEMTLYTDGTTEWKWGPWAP